METAVSAGVCEVAVADGYPANPCPKIRDRAPRFFYSLLLTHYSLPLFGEFVEVAEAAGHDDQNQEEDSVE